MTFSEGFTIGLAMSVLERQLADNATAYIVKQRAGMNVVLRHVEHVRRDRQAMTETGKIIDHKLQMLVLERGLRRQTRRRDG